ncbi:MAG: hypothetical protein P1R58_11135 [bacterium]|nr:hypothetical protein [bacterium]
MSIDKRILQSIIAVATLYILSRFFGSYWFDNNWTFTQFSHLSIWYKLIWVLLGGGLTYLFIKRSSIVEQATSSKRALLISLGGLALLLLLFRFDSFLFGGTNLLVNRIAIVETGLIRWYDSGSMLLVGLFYNLLLAIGGVVSDSTLYRLKLAAGVNSLTIFSFLATAASLWGAVRLTHLLCREQKKIRWAVFTLLFVGPQSLLYFGYIGMEPVVISFTIWIAYFIVRLEQEFKWSTLAVLWLLMLCAILFWFPNIYLLPAVFFAATSSFFRARNQFLFPYAATVLVFIVLLIMLYSAVSRDFWDAQFILGLKGRMPHSDYGLFSARHIGDMLQALWVLFPQVIIVGLLIWNKTINLQNRVSGALICATISGTTLIFLINPINSIPLDFPGLSAYLTPYAVLIAYLMATSKSESKYSLSKIMAAFAVSIPIGLLPSYVSIDNSQAHVDQYTREHELFSMPTIHAYRDAYFYKKDFDKANEWEWQLPTRSDAYLNFRGCQELVTGGKVSDALSVLPRIILQHPYWTDPRTLLADIHITAGRYNLARPQIDTCILANPYNPVHYQLLYRCLRDSRDYHNALTAIFKANELSPDNPDLLVDLMVINQFTGNLLVADSLATRILDLDSTQAFPYAMRGFIAESRGEDSLAMKNYERFIRMAPEDPESMKIRKRLNALVVRSRAQNP